MSTALLNARKQEVIAKVNACVEKGNRLYGITLPKLQIRFDLKGGCAGMAGHSYGVFYVRFNTDMMVREAWEHIINDTVPHEVAHSFCQFNPRLGRRHDAGWKQVCFQLGGSSERCHSEDVVYGKGRTFEYTTDRNHKVRVSETIHNKIQRGRTYTYREGKGTITKDSPRIVVGYQGRSITATETKCIVPATPTTFAPAQKPLPPVVFSTEAINAALLERFTHIDVPVAPTVPRRAPVIPAAGGSKADVARRIMVEGYHAGHNYETILQAIMLANGHDRRLAASYYKNNAPKVGVPMPF